MRFPLLVLAGLLIGHLPGQDPDLHPIDGARLPTFQTLSAIASEHWTGLPRGFDLPAEVDLRAYLPPPGDQGKQNACIAFALGYGLKSFQETLARGPIPQDSIGVFSPAHTFSPAFAYNLVKEEIETSDTVCLGSFFNDVFSVLVQQGICTWEELPYDPAPMGCFQRVPKDLMPKAAANTLATPLRVDPGNLDQLRFHLARSSPVAFAMSIDTAFKYGGVRSGREGRPFSWKPACSQPMPGSHAMLVVGYRDADSTFLALNSWGTTWGEGGYARIGYNEFRCHGTDAFVAQEALPGQWPALPLLVPGGKPRTGSTLRTRVRRGQSVQVNDLTIGLVHGSDDLDRVRLHLSDSSGTLGLQALDLEEDRPVRIQRPDEVVTVTCTRTARIDHLEKGRAHLKVEVQPGAVDPLVERSLQQAARIRAAR